MSTVALQPYRASYLTPALERATVVDAMHPGILTCAPDTPLVEVARLMSIHRVHCVAVAGVMHDANGESLVWRILSDADLAAAAAAGDLSVTAASVATDPPATAWTSDPLREAAKTMAEHKLSHLVVLSTNDGRPVGVLSTLDIAHVLAWGQVPAEQR
jgi:CBS domain-containing protein